MSYDYLQNSRNSNLKVGDKVKVIRIAKNDEDGWENSWIDEMDKAVNKIFEIEDEDFGSGFLLAPIDSEIRDCSFPYFVLQKIYKSSCKYRKE